MICIAKLKALNFRLNARARSFCESVRLTCFVALQQQQSRTDTFTHSTAQHSTHIFIEQCLLIKKQINCLNKTKLREKKKKEKKRQKDGKKNQRESRVRFAMHLKAFTAYVGLDVWISCSGARTQHSEIRIKLLLTKIARLRLLFICSFSILLRFTVYVPCGDTNGSRTREVYSLFAFFFFGIWYLLASKKYFGEDVRIDDIS